MTELTTDAARQKPKKRLRLTVNQLAKILQAEIDKGHGRRKVYIDKPTFWDGNNTFNICEVWSAEMMCVSTVDGDGFHVDNKDGSERNSMCFVLKGQFDDG